MKYEGYSIKEVARAESIILEFVTYKQIQRGGLCVAQELESTYLFESLAVPGRLIEARYPAVKTRLQLIAVAKDYYRGEEKVTPEEIFWHEYYHLRWSPELAPYDPDIHDAATHGVMDKKDERRADLFAASVLLAESSDLFTLSTRLREIVTEVEMSKQLFSRDWCPVYSGQ